MCTSWDYLCEIVFKTTQDDQPEPAVLAGMEQPSRSSDGCGQAEACNQVTVPPCQCAFGFAERGPFERHEADPGHTASAAARP